MNDDLQLTLYRPGLTPPDEVHYTVPQSTVIRTRRALEAGLDGAREALAVHDRDLGRTTRRNQVFAEVLESDIRLIEQALSELPTP